MDANRGEVDRGMLSNFQSRVLGLAIGAGALVAGLVMALLGLVLGPDLVGLVAAGMVIAAIGLLVALVGAIGFARHGSARSARQRTR